MMATPVTAAAVGPGRARLGLARPAKAGQGMAECGIPVWFEAERQMEMFNGTLAEFIATLTDDAPARQAYAAEIEREANQR